MVGNRVIQVTNIAPQTTKDQMHALFSYIGKIELIHLYPTIREVAVPGRSLVCYVKFVDTESVGVALQLTNTVFIDRALIVTPFSSNDIPDEQRAFEITRPGPKFAPGVTNQVEGFPPTQVIATHDPRLLENKLPLYPPLPPNTDAATIDELRRTVVVINLDRSLGSQDIIEIFSKAGEVKYVRFAYRPGDSSNYALIEFSDQTDIVAALQMNGMIIAGVPIQVYHSVQAITKPQPKSDEVAQREIQEAMSRVNEAQSLISAAIDPVMAMLKKDKKRSRSRSRGRYGRSRRSRSRSRRHRRSRSRHRRSRSRSGGRRRRSRSRSKSHKRSRRSRSRDRRRSRSRSRRRSRSKSSSRRDDRKSRDRRDRRDKDRKDRSKDRDRSRERERSKDRERSRSRDKSKDKGRDKSKSKDKDRSSKDIEEKDRLKSNGKSKRGTSSEKEEKSPVRRVSKSKSRSKSTSPKQEDDDRMDEDKNDDASD